MILRRRKMSSRHKKLFASVEGLDERMERMILKLAEKEVSALAELTAHTQDGQKLTGFYLLLPDQDIFGIGVDSRDTEFYEFTLQTSLAIMEYLTDGQFKHKIADFDIVVESLTHPQH